MGRSQVFGMLLGAALTCNFAALSAAQDATATGKTQASAASEVSATAETGGKEGASELSAKSAAQAAASSEEAAEVKDGLATLKLGTAISAQLDKTIDARKVKPGDIVSARVTKDVRQKGHTVIRKGDLLLGRVNSAEAGASGKAGSELAVAFDRLARGDAEYELNTVVSSVISTSGDMGAGIQSWPLPEPMIMPDPADGGGRAGGGVGGGLLGGATGTASSAVFATGSAAGGLAGDLNETAFSAAGSIGPALRASNRASALSGSALGLSTPVRDIHLNSQSSASQSGESTSVLRARHGDLRLESGTRMQFKVSNRTEVESSKK